MRTRCLRMQFASPQPIHQNKALTSASAPACKPPWTGCLQPSLDECDGLYREPGFGARGIVGEMGATRERDFLRDDREVVAVGRRAVLNRNSGGGEIKAAGQFQSNAARENRIR